MQVLQRPDWDGEPVEMGETLRLHKQRCGRRLVAICRLRTHTLGWELMLELDGDLHRSQVCRSQDDVLTRSERWRGTLLE